MCTNNDDLETEYDDVLFELTDIRERYPAKCANEYGECLRLTSEMSLKPLKLTREKLENTTITDEQMILFNMSINKEFQKLSNYNRKIEEMTNQVGELKVVLEQITNAKSCPLSKIINKE